MESAAGRQRVKAQIVTIKCICMLWGVLGGRGVLSSLIKQAQWEKSMRVVTGGYHAGFYSLYMVTHFWSCWCCPEQCLLEILLCQCLSCWNRTPFYVKQEEVLHNQECLIGDCPSDFSLISVCLTALCYALFPLALPAWYDKGQSIVMTVLNLFTYFINHFFILQIFIFT